MRFSRSLNPAFFLILCGSACVAQSPALHQQQVSPPPLPKSQVPIYRLQNQARVTFLKPGEVRLAGPAADGQRCYTLRQYQFEQPDPKSDATRLKDSTVCQPASKIRLKGAVVTPSR